MRTQFAIVAAVLSTSIIFTTPTLAQSSEPETLTRVIYNGQVVSGARVYRELGPVAYEQSVVDTLTFCDSRGTRNRANRWDDFDLDVRGSVRGGNRNADFGARLAGDVLEYYGDRERDRQRAQERIRDNLCRDVRDEFQYVRRQERSEQRVSGSSRYDQRLAERRAGR